MYKHTAAVPANHIVHRYVETVIAISLGIRCTKTIIGVQDYN